MFFFLSACLKGYLLSTTWYKRDAEGKAAIHRSKDAMGCFEYYPSYGAMSKMRRGVIKNVWQIVFYVVTGFFLYYFRPRYEVIVAYGPYITGFAGFVLKKLTGAKLLIEIPGNPAKALLFGAMNRSMVDSLKNRIGGRMVSFLLRRADHIKLLYPEQLLDFVEVDRAKVSVFHDFVGIKTLEPIDRDDKFILFLGFPWYLKGVDVLIKAFRLLCEEYPGYRLKVVGHCPNRASFEDMAGGDARIDLCEAVEYPEAMSLMARCSIVVLPSRTEAMGRVLLEAMALRKPIVASRVDGIPYYIKDGVNGLLFESENYHELADKIRLFLSKPGVAEEMATNGYRIVHGTYSEEGYVRQYKTMIDKIISI